MHKNTLLFLALMPLTAAAGDPFAGTYVGAQFGYLEGRDNGVEYDEGGLGGATQQTEPSGAVLGLVAGYNIAINPHLILGLETDLEVAVANDTSLSMEAGVADAEYPVTTEVRGAFSLRPRLGYLFNSDQSLVFVTAGFAMANIKRTFESLNTTPPSESGSEWQAGWTAGLGLEHLIGRNLSAKIEYRYTDLGSTDFSTALVYGDGDVEKQDYTDQAVRFGLLYHY
ncbi:MAG: outer membrane immunogenic protein [Motiliproteus sp.]|jgi:outer membrane immunogenic protein